MEKAQAVPLLLCMSIIHHSCFIGNVYHDDDCFLVVVNDGCTIRSLESMESRCLLLTQGAEVAIVFAQPLRRSPIMLCNETFSERGSRDTVL